MKMASLITLPTENILEIGSYLAEYRSQRHIVSLYSTCRRLRAILATSIHRRLGIAVDDPNLLEVVDFTKKNPYFARSLSAVRLTSTDLSSYPSESENDVESFLELKEDYEELYEDFEDVLSLGVELPYILTLLITFDRLETFHYTEKSGKPTLKMAVLRLLSSGKYLQKIKQFEYNHLYRLKSTPSADSVRAENALYSTKFEPKGSKQASGQLMHDQDAPARPSQLVRESATLEDIRIYDKNYDLQFLHFVIQIPSSLKVLDLCYTDYVPSKFLGFLRDIISMHASSIQRINISLDSVSLHRRRSGRIAIDAENLGHLRKCVALTHLKVPVDTLLGTNNDPANVNPILSWSRNLPSSLTHLFLGLRCFNIQFKRRLWTSSQILNGLIVGIPDLLIRCPDLRKVTVACLVEEDFQIFRTAVLDAINGVDILYDDAMEQEVSEWNLDLMH